MNRGRIDWAVISEVEVPAYQEGDPHVLEMVDASEKVWEANGALEASKARYVKSIAREMQLSGNEADERWLGFKPPE